MSTVNVTLRKKRKSGTELVYRQLRWQDQQGRQRTENIGRVDEVSERAAEQARKRKGQAIASGKEPRNKSHRLLVEYLERDKQAMQTTRKPATIIIYEHAIKHVQHALGDRVRLDKVSWEDVTALKKWLAHDHQMKTTDGELKTYPPCSKSTINRTMATLKAAFNRAKERGLVSDNPFAQEKLAKAQPKGMRVFSQEDIDYMVKACRGELWWEMLIRLLFTTGLRYGEAINLLWDDIDLEGLEVVVSAKRGKPIEKRGGPLLEWSTKTHCERRVPLPDDVVPLLKRLRILHADSPYVFISRQRLVALAEKHGTSQELPANIIVNNSLRRFKLIQQHAAMLLGSSGQPAEWSGGSFHDLRKSYGTHMAKHVPMTELRKLMGHSNITTTADYYVGACEDTAAKVREVFSHAS